MRTNGTPQEISKYASAHRRRKKWLTGITCLAAVVVFCTTYALILPAITLEADRTLACSYEVHEHDASCYDHENHLICGLADYVVHTHDENCYNADGNLVCTLEEIQPHEHTAECYKEESVLICNLEEEDDAHEHTSDCYETQSVLNCDKPEVILHTHTEDCYNEDENLICGLLQTEEHIHEDDCLEPSHDEKTDEDSSAPQPVETTEGNGSALLSSGETEENDSAKLPSGETEEVQMDKDSKKNAPAPLSDGDGEADKERIAPLSNEDTDAEVTASVTIGEDIYTAILTAITDTDTLETSVNDYAATLSGDQNYTTSDIDFYRITSLENGEGEVIDLSSLSGGDAVVSIIYTNGSCLAGTTGNRKLLILDMGEDGNVLSQSNELNVIGDVSKDAGEIEGYYSFTYEIKAADLDHVVAFTSLNLLEGYVSGVSVKKIIDGSEPWDVNDTSGNDNSDSNRIVRTFDTISYMLDVSSSARSSDKNLYSATLGLEMTMDKGLTEAEFDTDTMSWLGTNWRIEYLDSSDNVVLIKDSTGFYLPGNDGSKGEKTTVNKLIYGSSGDNTDNDNAYRDKLNIVKQRLTGFYTVKKENGDTAVPGTQEMLATILVQASSDGDTFQPSFRVWLEGNKANFGPEDNDGDARPGDRIADNQLTVANADIVTVSAAARYNIMLKQNTSMSYVSWFDFETGKEAIKEENGDYPGTATYGRMLGYGLTLQFYNATDAEDPDGRILAAKGLKGIELPLSGINFDLTLKTTLSGSGVEDGDYDKYTPILWDYTENVSLSGKSKYLYNGTDTPQRYVGNWNRNMYWENDFNTSYARLAAPYNSMDAGGSTVASCYDGGYWDMTWSTADNETNTGTIFPKDAVGDGSNVTYNFTVTDFNFDFDTWTFPTNNAGDTPTASWNAAYVGCFSAGHIQVLQQFPTAIPDTRTMTLTVETGNLAAKSLSDSVLYEGMGIQMTDGNFSDNKNTYTVPLYSVGNFTKYNSFGSETSTNYSTGFLGTSYWVTSYDPSTYAGDSIKMWGCANLGTTSDYRVKAVNLLQKFDSVALSIDKTLIDKMATTYTYNTTNQYGYTINAPNVSTIGGSAVFLYAADPMYPGGWDSNQTTDYPDEKGRLVGGMATTIDTISKVTFDGMVHMDPYSRMNTATEEDLIYFKSLDELEDAGYVCIGVLMEVRNCDIQGGGGSITMSVPMKVSRATECINTTVCTVNAARAWIGENKGETVSADSLGANSWASTTENNPIVCNGETGYEPEGVFSYTSQSNYKNGQPNGYVTPTTSGRTVEEKGYGFNNYNTPASGYIKTEYDSNGQYVTGTHLGGYLYGMSLLILGYKSGVKIEVSNNMSEPPQISSSTSSTVTFDIGQGQWTADYTIYDIKTEQSFAESTQAQTKTNLKIGVMLDEKLTIKPGSFVMKGIAITGTATENATPVTFRASKDNEEYTIKVYAVMDASGNGVNFYLSDVPVGYTLPNITYSAELSSSAANNDTCTATVTISGDQDNRSFTSEHGNIDQVDIKIVALVGTSLSKTVSDTLVEQNGAFKYELKYTNTGNNELKDTLYLYDISPYNGDIRSSAYTGNVDITKIEGKLINEEGTNDEFTAQVRFYYSTLDGDKLKSIIDFAGMPDTSGLYLRQLLGNALVDEAGNIYFFQNDGENVDLYTYDGNGAIAERNFELGDDGYTVKKLKDNIAYETFVKVTNVIYEGGSLSYTTEAANFAENTYTKLFRYLGDLTQANHDAITDNSDTNESSSSFSRATCIFAVARNLGAGKSLCIDINVETDGNIAADLYGNIAHSWISGSAVNLTLLSNQVYTRTVSREISGVVWYDANLNGVWDDGNEALLNDVTATLFKWDNETAKYILCKEDVTGEPINSAITGEDGAYNFSKLAAGEYVVAFSGDALNKYTGATTYQVEKNNDENSNDGVALGKTDSSLDIDDITFIGIDENTYKYAIAYNLSDNDTTVGNMLLHTLDGYKTDSSLLTDYQEKIDHQDLGLVIAGYELPNTGGTGTTKFIIGGLLLMAGAAGCGYRLRRRRERRVRY